ncbi:MAG: single-stranded DNA-binding protein [Planctomycetota bacterium]
MPANYNKIILVGNLTRDPQLTYLPSQTPVVEFGLAVNRRWRDRDGNQREDTCFVDCRSMGRGAEVINQYMSKGQSILVDGRLELNQWEDQQGNRRSKHRVFVENFQFMGSPGGGGQGGGRSSEPPSQAPPRNQRPQQRQPSVPPQEYEEPPSPYDQGEGGDEIPF